MLTIKQKAEAWDGLKNAMIEITQSPRYSTDCKRMANEFLLMMREVELKAKGNHARTIIEMLGEAPPVVAYDYLDIDVIKNIAPFNTDHFHVIYHDKNEDIIMTSRRFETRSGVTTDVDK